MAANIYPFRPKSTSQLLAGQFWAIPLPSGRFACGRVLQIGGSEIPTKRRTFFGGLQDWVGEAPPSVQSIAGTAIVKYGVMHIRAITELGGEILGYRQLESDDIPTLLNAMGGPGTMVLQGANAIRTARHDELGAFPVLGFWGFDFIHQLAILLDRDRPSRS